jgi:hypothetical protein
MEQALASVASSLSGAALEASREEIYQERARARILGEQR